MPHPVRGAWLLSLLIAGCLAVAARGRVWRDSAGKTMEAEFVTLVDGNVHLQLPDKRRVTVPLKQLSEADQRYVRELLGAVSTMWTDNEGNTIVVGSFVGLKGGVVRLRGSDGKVVAVPLKKFCDEDRKYIHRLAGSQDEPGGGRLTDQAAIEPLAMLGAEFSINPDSQQSPTLVARFGPQWRGGREGLKHIRSLKRLTGVIFSHPDADDQWMAALIGQNALSAVTVRDCKVTDAGLVHLAAMKNLSTLHLESTAVTDAGLRHVTGLTALRSLDLSRNRITDRGFASLARLANLEILVLTALPITDRGFETLAAFPKLRALQIEGT